MKQDATNAESSENRHTRFMNGRAGSVLSELDGSLLTNPTHRYPPGGGAGRRSPIKGICRAVPFSGNSDGLAIRSSAMRVGRRVAHRPIAKFASGQHHGT